MNEKEEAKLEKLLIQMWKIINQTNENQLLIAELFELVGCIYYKWGDNENSMMYHEKALSARNEQLGKNSLK